MRSSEGQTSACLLIVQLADQRSVTSTVVALLFKFSAFQNPLQKVPVGTSVLQESDKYLRNVNNLKASFSWERQRVARSRMSKGSDRRAASGPFKL